jgi:hypothetical protein
VKVHIQYTAFQYRGHLESCIFENKSIIRRIGHQLVVSPVVPHRRLAKAPGYQQRVRLAQQSAQPQAVPPQG